MAHRSRLDFRRQATAPPPPGEGDERFYVDASGALRQIDPDGTDTAPGGAGAHTHAGSDITSGTVADDRIAGTIARDSEITAAVAAVVNAAPSSLDTLKELADALGDDANYAATITAALAGKQPLDADLTAIAALATTSIGRSLLAAADAAALRTILGLGTASTHATGDYDAAGAAAAAQAASQPLDSDLTAIAALSTTSFGRSLLALADAAALASAHTHTKTGTVGPL